MRENERQSAPQWYPGHMARARRMLKENLRLIDLVIEVLDARIPASSQNPDFETLFAEKMRLLVLAKNDLASAAVTRAWTDAFSEKGISAVPFSSRRPKDAGAVLAAVDRVMRPTLERFLARGVKKTVRALVAGIPNAGKSTLINRLSRGNPAAVGNKPGVTRGKQWVKAGPYFELLDTPGLLWPRLGDREVAMHIAYVGSIRDEVTDPETLAAGLLSELYEAAPQEMNASYGDKGDMDGETFLYELCHRRNWMVKPGAPDTERMARAVIDDFRAGKLGRISLERPDGR
ncbi:MAG: ribosome biogenesis GTPase YlqF [Christensenellales bacterium]|jgi:ribosome biogenesis GTPase A